MEFLYSLHRLNVATSRARCDAGPSHGFGIKRRIGQLSGDV